MKILKLKSILLSLVAVVMVTVFLSSCEKDRANLSDTEAPRNEEQAFSNKDNLPNKEITLSDELGNSVTLKISTEDKELLNLYTDKVFEANFNEENNETFDADDFEDDSNETGFLHDTSKKRVKVFIEIAELSLRNTTSFSLTSTAYNELALRHYNVEKWYKARVSSAIKVRCSARGKDGLSAYGYQSTTAHCDAYWGVYSSKYFYDQNSGSKTFWRDKTGCLLVKTVGLHNDVISYIR